MLGPFSETLKKGHYTVYKSCGLFQNIPLISLSYSVQYGSLRVSRHTVGNSPEHGETQFRQSSTFLYNFIKIVLHVSCANFTQFWKDQRVWEMYYLWMMTFILAIIGILDGKTIIAFDETYDLISSNLCLSCCLRLIYSGFSMGHFSKVGITECHLFIIYHHSTSFTTTS